VPPCYAEMAAQFAGRVDVCDCVVDRVCVTIENRERDADGCRIVVAHPVKEWVIEDRAAVSPEIMAALGGAGVIVTRDLTAWEERKLWTVNGLHLLLALAARLSGVQALTDAVGDPRFAAVAARFTTALAAAHAASHPDFAVDQQYLDDRLRVFSEVPDTTDRILKARLVREDLTSLLARLDTRVFVVAARCSANGVPVDAFEDIVELLLDVLAREHLYYPAGPGTTRVGDDEILRRFAALLGRWAAPQQCDDYVARLRRILILTAP
jgi:hypothetical protein